jgi:hypothetical protein
VRSAGASLTDRVSLAATATASGGRATSARHHTRKRSTARSGSHALRPRQGRDGSAWLSRQADQSGEGGAEGGIFVWDGNYYALNLSERLGVEDSGGMIRIGLVHYNTREEIDRLLAALAHPASKA